MGICNAFTKPGYLDVNATLGNIPILVGIQHDYKTGQTYPYIGLSSIGYGITYGPNQRVAYGKFFVAGQLAKIFGIQGGTSFPIKRDSGFWEIGGFLSNTPSAWGLQGGYTSSVSFQDIFASFRGYLSDVANFWGRLLYDYYVYGRRP